MYSIASTAQQALAAVNELCFMEAGACFVGQATILFYY